MGSTFFQESKSRKRNLHGEIVLSQGKLSLIPRYIDFEWNNSKSLQKLAKELDCAFLNN